MKMGTCDLCQTKGPIEPCEFWGPMLVLRQNRGVCADDHEHLMQWCMDCEEILAKRSGRTDWSVVSVLLATISAALEHDINRRWKKKNQKPTGTVSIRFAETYVEHLN